MGMRNFVVLVRVMMPYPKEYQVVVQAHDYGTAVNRAWREVRDGELKGRRLNQITFVIRNLGSNELERIRDEELES